MKLPITISFSDAKGKSFNFGTLEQLEDFLKTEAEFWLEKDSKLKSDGLSVTHSYLTSFNNMRSALGVVESWKPQLSVWDESTFNGQISSLQSNHLNQLSSYWLWSGHAFIDAWLKCYQQSQATGDAFLDVVFNRNLGNFSNCEYMRGYLLAYEFLQQDESLITKRRDAEKSTFATIRGQLSKKKDDLIIEVAEFQEGITAWKVDTTSVITQWQAEQKKHYDDTSISQSKNFQEHLGSWIKSIADLEETYKEKLRLDGPATYWNRSAEKFKSQAYLWVSLLVLISCVFILYLSNFFIAWLQGHPIELKLQTLEGVVLFASVISAFALLVRTFSRLAFSAFHLQRDAEEREQLTHLYLSLANETEVDVESRRIVLQALFSRSETGLLANESGPTMPGITEVVNLIGKGGK
jgi:hypothetical protein